MCSLEFHRESRQVLAGAEARAGGRGPERRRRSYWAGERRFLQPRVKRWTRPWGYLSAQPSAQPLGPARSSPRKRTLSPLREPVPALLRETARAAAARKKAERAARWILP